MSTRRLGVLASLLGALWLPQPMAATTPANAGAATAVSTVASTTTALPGDDALTCDEIYAQGMAQTQQDQQARSRHIEQMRQQSNATATMLTGAMLAGGLGGTGQAAQAMVEGQSERQMAMLTPPPSNPRMDHLKQLWAQKHCVRR